MSEPQQKKQAETLVRKRRLRYKLYIASSLHPMASMIHYIQKPHPLIAARVEYTLAPAPPLPSITPRVEFTAERLAYSRDVVGRGNQATTAPEGQNDNDPSISPQGDAESSTVTLLRNRSASKIPKPTGEPGRPGSGGFCVEDSLKMHKWSEESVSKLTVCTTELISSPNGIDNTRAGGCSHGGKNATKHNDQLPWPEKTLCSKDL